MATGWWGGLTDSISSMAKDVLTEGTEEVDDHATALQIEQRKTAELAAQNTAIKAENESLRTQLKDVNDSLQSSELQINAVNTEYKSLISDKQEEIKSLKKTVEELNESNKTLLLSSSGASASERSHYSHFNQPHSNGGSSAALDAFSEDIGDELSDVLSHQSEINRLNSELERVRAESLHWKREAKRATTPQSQQQTVAAASAASVQQLDQDTSNLLARVEQFQSRLDEQTDLHKYEIEALEESQKEVLAELKVIYTKELGQLHARIEELENGQESQHAASQHGEDDESEASQSATSQDQDEVERIRKVGDEVDDENALLSVCLRQCQKDLASAKEVILAHAKQNHDERERHKQEIRDLEQTKLESLRCVNETMTYVQHRDKHKKALLRSELLQLSQTKDDELASLTEQLHSCKIDLGAAKIELKICEDGAADTKAQLESTKAQLESTKAQLESTTAQLESSIAERKEAQSMIRKQQNLVTLYESQLQSVRNELESSRKDLESCKAEFEKGDGQDEVTHLREQLKAVEAEHQAELVRLQTESSDLKEENGSLNQSISDLDQEHEVIVSQLIQQRDELKRNNQSLVTELEELSSSHSPTVQQADEVAHLQTKLEKASIALNDLHMGKAETQLELSNTKAKLKLLAEKYKEISKKNKESQAELEATQQAAADVTDGIKSAESHRELEQKLAETSEELMLLKRQLDEAKSAEESRVRLELELSQSEAKAEDLANKLDQSQAELDQLVDNLNQSQKAETENLSTMQQSLDASNEVIGKLKGKLSERTEECDELVKSLSEKERACMKLDSDLQLARKELKDSEAEITSLNLRNASQLEQISAAAADASEHQRELSALQKDLQTLQTTLDNENRESPDEVRDRNDSELTEPVEEEDLDSPRGEDDSASSITEVQELKTQLAEVQELLAQKVLLINELQGDHDGNDSDANDSFIMVERKVSTLETSAPSTADAASNTLPKLESELSQTKGDLQASKLHSSQLETRVKTIESDLKTAISEKDQLSLECISCKKSLDQALKERDGLQSELDTVASKLAEVENQAADFKTRLAESEGMHSKLATDAQTSADALTKAVAEKELEISNLRAELDSQTELMNSNTSELHGATQQLKSQLQSVQNDNEQLRADLGKVENELLKTEQAKSSADSQVSQLEGDCGRLEGEVEGLNARVQQIEAEKLLIDQELHAKSDEMVRLKSAAEVLSSEKLDLQGSVDELSRLQQRIEAIEDEKNNLQEALKAKGDELGAVSKKSAELNSKLQGLESSIRDLNKLPAHVKQLESEKRDLELQLTTKSEEAVEVQATVDILNNQIQTLEGAIHQKDEKIEELNDSVTQGDSDVTELDSQLERLEEALNSKTTEVEELKRRVNERRSSVSESVQTLQTPNPPDTQPESPQRDTEEGMTDELKAMRLELMEKDRVIQELQNSNRSLKHTLSVYGDLHSLENQVRSLKIENEQMASVIGEKSREISTLKRQVQGLMEANSSRVDRDSEQGDMSRQTIRKLSGLLKDKEIELEALKSKNDSLLAILQGQPTDGPGANVPTQPAAEVLAILEEKAKLEQELTAYKADREQLVVALQTKHNEAVAYHAEATRLQQLLQQSESTESTHPAQSHSTAHTEGEHERSEELETLSKKYIQTKQQLIDTQLQLSEYRQKCTDLTSQVSNSQSHETVPATLYDKLSQELQDLKSRLERQKEALLEKDKEYESIQQRLSSGSESQSLLQSECNALRKQIENLTFELSETRAALDDGRDTLEKCRVEVSQKEEAVRSLRQAEIQLQCSVQERDRMIASLTSQVNSAGQTEDEERTTLRNTITTLTSERDAAHLTAQTNYAACQGLHADLEKALDVRSKLEQEVERLRSHLVSIEEGYTGDLLQSEDREKELRNRLAVAEEKAAHTTTAVQHASLEASRQITSLEEQLGGVMAERDDLVIQLSTSQEQCAQYNTQLNNLQLVLEQFQAEKDSMHLAEVSKLKSDISSLKAHISDLTHRLSTTQSQLSDQTEALEAAQRLSEQLERKEEAMSALRDEVTLRERRLLEAEQEIRKLSNTNEGKVDKNLMRNLIVNHQTATSAKKNEVLQLIARVLTFSEEDMIKVGLAGPQHGWIGGILSRIAQPPPSPSKAKFDQSFSELFVKFLETESAPKPEPLKLPVDRMVQEEQRKAEQHHRQPAAFNPFIAASSTAGIVTSTPARNSQPAAALPLLLPSNTAGIQMSRDSPLFPASNQKAASMNPLIAGTSDRLTPVSATQSLAAESVRFIPISTG